MLTLLVCWWKMTRAVLAGVVVIVTVFSQLRAVASARLSTRRHTDCHLGTASWQGDRGREGTGDRRLNIFMIYHIYHTPHTRQLSPSDTAGNLQVILSEATASTAVLLQTLSLTKPNCHPIILARGPTLLRDNFRKKRRISNETCRERPLISEIERSAFHTLRI